MATAPQPSMQLAEILSDLVSLRICDPDAALALVSARSTAAASTDSITKQSEEDVDLKRAKDLVGLHYSVREKHRRGDLGRGLVEARESVERAVGG